MEYIDANLSWGGGLNIECDGAGQVFSLGIDTDNNRIYFAFVPPLDKLLLNFTASNFTASNSHKMKPGIRHNLW